LILDTDILVALLKGEADADEAIRRIDENGERVATTVITAYELLRCVYISNNLERNLAQVHELLFNLEILDLTVQACEEASKIHRDLRKAGCLIGEFDMLIAAITRTQSETIMTRDDHFARVQGIKIAKW
jgi:tRNA(fMet)-specific endonuclease VapC